MNKLEDLIAMKKLQELLGRKEEKKEIPPVCWVIAGLLIVAVIGAVAFAVYRYFTPDYLDDFEDDFEDDFDDEFFDDDEQDEKEEKKESSDGDEKEE